jgi:hypothetical protein
MRPANVPLSHLGQSGTLNRSTRSLGFYRLCPTCKTPLRVKPLSGHLPARLWHHDRSAQHGGATLNQTIGLGERRGLSPQKPYGLNSGDDPL